MRAATEPTPEAYLATLPRDRRDALAAVRATVRANLPAGYEEAIQYGMIAYRVPLARYPKTYNGQPLTVACLGSQKSHMAIYLMSIYGDAELKRWFEAEYRKTGKRLDVGKSCVRFRTLEALPLDVVGSAIAKVDVDAFVAMYEASRGKTATTKTAANEPATKSPAPAKKTAAKKPATKKPATKSPAPAKKTAAKKPATKARAVRRSPPT